ncbi:Serine protease, subtilisin family [Deinococcus reticulitermitis]|uniref:Serine protease, subtilisin family n=1 Tax=Deinococcus reticulitermitis TaxID=856736 RepID=A0A1H6SW80_9DEIO|nr:S8 family serine peptidase [Deinococcus reticulitermitis]SEI70044.1 Serine protease, subtilisin family [Deinococcus reticulitermitis]
MDARRRLALASLALLLAGCGQLSVPDRVRDQTFDLGLERTVQVSQPHVGRWTVAQRPPWLQVSAGSGEGDLDLTVTADRALATPLTASQPQLSGDIVITWASEDGTEEGRATWTVRAEQYRLTGRVLDTARVTGRDVAASSTLQTGRPRQTRGVIVTYRRAAVRDGVTGKGATGERLQAQDAGTEANRAEQTLRALGIPAAARHSLGPRSVLLDTVASDATLSALRADPGVASVTANVVLHALSTAGPETEPGAPALASPVTPGDQYAALQWAYPLLGYRAVWRDMESGGYTRPVTVAVADSGVRFDHPDLAEGLWTPEEGAFDAVTTLNNGDGDGADADPTDPSVPGRTVGSHGTHVAGIIVARWGENGASCEGCSATGVVGASYKAPVKVLPIRVLDAQGNTDVATVVSAVQYAAGLPVTLGGQTFTNPHPAQVINLSLGGDRITPEEAQPMCDAIAEARTRGVLTFAAAGNGAPGATAPFYPAACEAAVAVGSVTLSGGSAPIHAVYSSTYAQVQLSAPGGSSYYAPTYFTGGTLSGTAFPDDILSTGWDYRKDQPNYEVEAGTSQATPQAAALAALLLSKGVTTGAEDTLARMVETSTDLGEPGRDPRFGHGMINAAAALGAPAVSDALGLRLQSERGLTFQPPLDALGRFTAYLGDGGYTVIGGRDRDANGLYGEAHEPRDERSVILGPGAPQVDLGDLKPAP